jgi:two-component system response regulator MprA
MTVRARILVIDDDPKIVAFLRRGLAFEGYQVVTAGNGEEGLQAALAQPPDLVILDVMMPGLDGYEVCRRLRAGLGASLPILMLTARDAVADRVKGLDTGADDYLIKPFAFEELLARLRALLRRAGPGGEAADGGGEVLSFGDLSLNLATWEARRGERTFDLTAKEFELLSLFLRNPRRVLSRDLIMEQVWGFDYAGESNVLEVYVGYLRNKLEAGGEPRILHTVRGAGYVLRE